MIILKDDCLRMLFLGEAKVVDACKARSVIDKRWDYLWLEIYGLGTR